jgi:UDP-glucuronate 4-epimerase
MKTILVTGGAGFIGSSLIDQLLLLGFKVINVDNFNDFYDIKIKESNITNHFTYKEQYQLFRLDITDKKALENTLSSFKIDAIIHLAARAGVRPSIDNPHQYFLDNVMGTQNILDFAKDYGIKNLVLASSSSVYGNNIKIPFSETDNVDQPISPYAATKKSNELQAYTYHKLFNLNVILLRFFTVYGPRQRPDLAIHKFTKLILNDQPIPFYGDGSSSRDYTYISDIVEGIIKALDYNNHHSNVYKILNLGNNNPVSLMDMVKSIEQVTGKIAKLNRLPHQQGDVNITFADISLAKNTIDYKVSTDFKTGIQKFYNWFINK